MGCNKKYMQKNKKIRIQIDGGGKTNKGAQLMLFAVLQEIETKYPDAVVFLNNDNPDLGNLEKFTPLQLVNRHNTTLRRLIEKFHVVSIARKISMRLASKFTLKNSFTDVDVILNIGGFQFGDQWMHDNFNLYLWGNYCKVHKEHGAKMILLPQAFGPFENPESKKIVTILNSNIDLAIAREEVSFNYLLKAGFAEGKLRNYPDFTALVDGIFPEKYRNVNGVKNGVCLIPNKQMVNHKIISYDGYIDFWVEVIQNIQKKGYTPFLLNHEGIKDYDLCMKVNKSLDHAIPYISGLNAVEIKGVIANSYLVVSSRFHGVASALSSGTPCLATSWSHKYEMLFNDFNQTDRVLNLSNFSLAIQQIESLLKPDENSSVRIVLSEAKRNIVEINKSMWNEIWYFSKLDYWRL